MSKVQVDVQAAIPERQAPPPTVGEQLPRRVYIRQQVYRVPTCEIGIEAGGSQRGMPCQNCRAHDR